MTGEQAGGVEDGSAVTMPLIDLAMPNHRDKPEAVATFLGGHWSLPIRQRLSWSLWDLDVGFRRILDLVYPASCACCGRSDLPAPYRWALCRDCLLCCTAPLSPACRRCGQWLPVLEDDVALPCPHCATRKTGWPLEAVHFLGPYEGLLRGAVLRMKRRVGRPLALAMGTLLGDRCRLSGGRWELVVPLPVHWRRKLRGTFDRCEVLARQVARRTGVDSSAVLTLRRRPAKQGLLSPALRRRNVANVFRISARSAISGKTILLVDDVVTTGATACEAARTLLRAGAAAVELAVVARAMQGRPPRRGAVDGRRRLGLLSEQP